jgi:predicted enzyme related to lactoylglutathione lyase
MTKQLTVMATPLIGSVTRIILFVKDVSKVAAFYIDILGLQPLNSINDDWVELGAGGCNIALHKTSKKATEKHVSKIVFGVTDVQKSKLLLEDRGVTMGKIFSFEGIEFCNGKDPEGNLFQISNRGM